MTKRFVIAGARVAYTAMAAVQEERERCARVAENEAETYRALYVLEGFREDLRRKDAAERIATLIRRKPADRPAPEGAAHPCQCLVSTTGAVECEADRGNAPRLDWHDKAHGIKERFCRKRVDLARPRCSTPSQEDTGSVSGTAWRSILSLLNNLCGIWERFGLGIRDAIGNTNYAAIADLIKQIDGLPALPPTDASGPGSASNTDAAQERHLTPGEQSVMQRALRNSTAESSPTQTVAAPGPTAGNVERRKYVRALAVKMRPFEERAAELLARCERGYEDDEPHRINIIATALMEQADAACAELLAQIIHACGPQEREAWSRDAIWAADTIRNRVRALADKLTEAK